MNNARLFLQCEMTEPELIALAGGQACVFSSRCPGKPTPNEDAALLMPAGETAALLAVADGMGGESHGEIASRLAVESLQAEVAALAGSEGLLRTAVIDGIERANAAVQQTGSGAGTTLAAVELSGGAIRTYHIGDSVVLVVGGRGKIKLQTVAHSPVGYGVESGLLDEGDAMHHDERHVVSNFIGAANMRIDIGSPITLARRDTVLLASDGLFDNLHVEEVAEIIRRGSLPRAMAELAATAARRMATPDDGRPSKPDDLTMVAFRRGS
jgi:serine/threonine protein phosphatase PrpC